MLTGSEVASLLHACGLLVAREMAVATPQAAAEAAAGIGFPVVLKAVCRDLVHKSDVGAVRLGLESPAAVETAAGEMAAALARSAATVHLEGFVVQETVRGEAEVIIGARRDPLFGPVVMVGLGGIAVEIWKDVALAPAPVSAARARAMLASLVAAPLFTGGRGRPPLDLDAIVDAVVRISWLAVDLGPRLVDLEVNPLIVRRAGGGAVVVDGRGTLTNTSQKEPRT